ncbi:hypothetical protein ScPMuIL_002206, partial [Solemya velum]
LSNRFEADEELLKASSVVQLDTWPEKISEELDFGDRNIALLIEKFSPALETAGIDPGVIEPEWTRLKIRMYERFSDVPNLSWKQVNEGLGNRCPNVLALVDLILSLPASSAEAERGFSQMGLVKSDWRSRLLDTSLSDLLVVKLRTPDILDFDPTEAVALWLSDGMRSRRPNFTLADSDDE